MRNGNDWEGLTDRFDSERQEAEAEQKLILWEIFDALERGERLNTGKLLFLRWYCNCPVIKDLRQVEMAMGVDANG